MAIPLVYWGYAILFAGGATTLALVDEQEIGKVELPDSIDRLFNPHFPSKALISLS